MHARSAAAPPEPKLGQMGGANIQKIFERFFWCTLHGGALRLRTSPVRSVTPWVEWAVPTTFTERAPEPERSSSNRTVRPGNHGPAKSPGHPIHSVTPWVEWVTLFRADPLGATCAKKMYIQKFIISCPPAGHTHLDFALFGHPFNLSFTLLGTLSCEGRWLQVVLPEPTATVSDLSLSLSMAARALDGIATAEVL